ncbi:MAG: 4-coumarate--CoA ligase family protein [Thermomicrobiales bacterium]
MVVFRSPHPDVEIPTNLSLPDFLFQRAAPRRDKVAFVDGETGATLTFGEVIEDSRRVAAGYAALGLQRGEVVALYSPNNLDWPIAYYGALLAGAVVTTVNPLHTSDELRRQLDDTNAAMILTTSDLIERVDQIRSATNLRDVITFDGVQGTVSFKDLLDHGPAPHIELDPASVCLLPSSSGTTGRPKAVMLTHENIVANIIQCEGGDFWTEKDVLINVLPFYHLAGLGIFLNLGFAAGSTMVLLPRFDLELMLAGIEKHRVNKTFLVPPILLAMAKDPRVDRYDLSSLTSVICSAAPVGRELSELFSNRLDCELREGFGMTETSPGISVNPSGRIVHGSAGPLMPGTEGKIVNTQTGEDLGAHELGEIWIRGPQVMKGYLNRPDATAITITPDGWLRTGDIGYVDEDGYFYIVDRLKELIKYKAYQVAPAELEDVLKGHPDILDAAVVGSPDAEAGELPKAFIVADGNLSQREVIDYVAARVAPYKKIRLVEFIDAIPKNPSGKILRRELIERERAPAASTA